MKTLPTLDSFTRAYIECALWSSTDDNGDPMDRNYSADDLAPETLERIIADCAEFQSGVGGDLGGMEESRAGHCFWLSRNGHGSGFFDEDTLAESERKEYQAYAHTFGHIDLYTGDDGKLYLA